MTADSTNLLNTLNYISANPLGPSGVWYRCVVSFPSCCPPPGWFQVFPRVPLDDRGGGAVRTVDNLLGLPGCRYSEPGGH